MASNFSTLRNIIWSKRYALLPSALAFGIGFTVIVGWLLEIEFLKSISPSYITMKANTALGLISLALAYIFFTTKSSFCHSLGKVLCATAVLIGSMTLAQYLFAIDLHIDQLFFHDLSAKGRFPPGRLAPITAVCLVLLGVAGTLSSTSRPFLKLGRQFVVIVAAISAFQALVGYACGITYTFGQAYYSQMAVHTAVGLLALSVAFLSFCTEEGLIQFLLRKGSRGQSSRRMFFAALFIPPLIIILQVKGRSLSIIDGDTGTLLQIICNMSFFIAIVWNDSLKQSLSDQELELTRFSLEMAEDAAQVGFWNYDLKDKIVVGTLFHDQLYGRINKVDKWELKDILAAIHPDDRHIFTDQHAKAVRDRGSSFAMEYRVVWPDESVHWLSVMVRIKRDTAGQITHYRGIVLDSTYVHEAKREREQLEIRESAALESLRLKSEFLANMSHEIRTPINGVMGMTNILLDSKLDHEQKEFALAIKRSGQTLLTVINDILDFSKIEANKLDFEEIDFSLAQTLEDSVSSIRHMAGKKSIFFQVDFNDKQTFSLLGDPARLQQIITNLLSNAVKFTAKGSVIFRVAHVEDDALSAKYRFEVEDTGIGLSEESQAKLFQPFQQADNSTTRKYGGTGLGLSISRHLVERLKGEIGVTSVEGQGSTFWFTAVFAKSTTDASEGSNAREAAVKLPFVGHRRILIAEDVPVNQIVATRMIEKLGHFAHVVANGKECIDALYQSDYDLILMDCHMPEMDGYEATSVIRQSTTLSNPNIIILAMTANAMKGDKEKCLNVGMNDYISKPIEPKALERMLYKWLATDASKIKSA